MSSYESVPGLGMALDDGVLTLRLSRPEKRNAINDTMMDAAIDAVDRAGRGTPPPTTTAGCARPG